MPENPENLKNKKKKRKNLVPSSEDQEVWEQFARDILPLPSSLSTKAAKPLSSSVAGKSAVRAAKPAVTTLPLAPLPSSPPQMDRRSRQKFERGEMEIHGRIDLHGLTQNVAHDRLVRFLSTHIERGSRCLLIITGKGRNKETGVAEGVIRQNLPHWLNSPIFSPYILALQTAHAKHGGSGAFYLLLKRQRR